MFKKLTLFLTISLLSLSYGMNSEIELSKSPIEIIQCLYTSPIIVKDVIEIINLIKQREYMKIISFIIEKYPEIKNEVVKCINEQSELFLENQYKNDEEPQEDYILDNLIKCHQCYLAKGYNPSAVSYYCLTIERCDILTHKCKNQTPCSKIIKKE